MAKLLFLLLLFFVSSGRKTFGLTELQNVIQNIHKTQISNEFDKFKYMNPVEIIQDFGYPAEKHYVTTEDGYILELHRIPHGLSGPSTGSQRPVVFLQHGLFCASSDWVMDKPGRALAYLLADAGYDVWMNNFRGNTYSRNHTTLDPDKDKKKFWDFTWNEMSIYDIPAAIDYALEETGNTKLHYIGFSLGTTAFLAFMSEKPEYANKIQSSALLGPISYVSHFKGPLKIVGEYSKMFVRLLKLMGKHEIMNSGPFINWTAEHCEKDDVFLSFVCYNMLYLIGGYDTKELNKDFMSVILHHTPAGSSINTLNQYFQNFHSGSFKKYNYGLVGNLKRYKRISPPKYNLNVSMPPIGLFWGQNDWLVPPEDIARLSSEINNVVLNYKIQKKRWNHLDFIWAMHAKEFLYDHVIDFLKKY